MHFQKTLGASAPCRTQIVVRLEKYDNERHYSIFFSKGAVYPETSKEQPAMLFRLPKLFEPDASKINFSKGISYAGHIIYEMSSNEKLTRSSALAAVLSGIFA